MIICPQDDGSHKNWWGARFCGACGTRLLEKKVFCKDCGCENSTGNDLTKWSHKFCSMCGGQNFETKISKANEHTWEPEHRSTNPIGRWRKK